MKKIVGLCMLLAASWLGASNGDMAPGKFKQMSVAEQKDYLRKNPRYTLPNGILKKLDGSVQDLYNQRGAVSGAPGAVSVEGKGMAPGQFKKLSVAEQTNYLLDNSDYELPSGIVQNLDAQVRQTYELLHPVSAAPGASRAVPARVGAGAQQPQPSAPPSYEEAMGS